MINKRTTFGKANDLYIKLPKPFHRKELKKLSVSELKKLSVLELKKLSGSELKNCRTSNTDISNTDISNIEINDTNDLHDIANNNFIKHHSNHTNHQQTEFNNDALKFQNA
ncbi:hypothetical protein [Staphylococcus aureus]|uniref:hypothetical protein n=1 Tax=Staphylococcus aureus TaxID=1280 RepID=UPI001CEC274B|nr:hypothetical protein [Staphylococcus aureus]